MKFHSESRATFVSFALMGRKHDAEVEFTCCHSQKSAKVGFSKGFLSDLIGPDRASISLAASRRDAVGKLIQW